MFAAFFLGEYANILLMSSLFVIFFLSGGNSLLLQYILPLGILIESTV
jgi:NADH:ubiquinone oxidoreductase subunit H